MINSEGRTVVQKRLRVAAFLLWAYAAAFADGSLASAQTTKESVPVDEKTRLGKALVDAAALAAC